MRGAEQIEDHLVVPNEINGRFRMTVYVTAFGRVYLVGPNKFLSRLYRTKFRDALAPKRMSL